MDCSSTAIHTAFADQFETLSSFDGEWKDQWGEPLCTISGSDLQWSDGGSTCLEVVEPGVIKLSLLDGVRAQAKLNETGTRLIWDDGETWHRTASSFTLLAMDARFSSHSGGQLDVAEVLATAKGDVRGGAFANHDDAAINLALTLCKDQGLPMEIRLGFVRKIYGTVCTMLAIVCLVSLPFWLCPKHLLPFCKRNSAVIAGVAKHSLFAVVMQIIIRLSLVTGMPFLGVAAQHGSLASIKAISSSRAFLLASAIANGILLACGAARFDAAANLAFMPIALTVLLALYSSMRVRHGLRGYGPSGTPFGVNGVLTAHASGLLCGLALGAPPVISTLAVAYGCCGGYMIETVGASSMMALVLGRLESVVDLPAVVAWDVFHGCIPYGITAVCRLLGGCLPSDSGGDCVQWPRRGPQRGAEEADATVRAQ